MSLKEVLGQSTPWIEIMDIGAALLDGEPKYTDILEINQGRVTGFEPDEKQYDTLTKTLTGDKYKFYPYFLGDGGKAKFNITKYPGCSSMLQPDPKIINLFTGLGTEPNIGHFSVVKTLDVETKRLDDIEGLPKPDFIKIDVQGAELKVLENGLKALKNSVVVEIECEFLPLYKNQPIFCDIQSFMREHGFCLHKMFDVAGRCFRPFIFNNDPFHPMSQLLWADCIFVRDFSDLSRYSDVDLLKSALLLHDLYSSLDMVNFLLLEHDKRRNSRFSDSFIKLYSSRQITIEFMNIRYH